MSPIKAAIAAIKSLEPGQQFSYRKIAIQYGCSRTSLARDNSYWVRLYNLKFSDGFGVRVAQTAVGPR
jgi:hypothetical protein